MTLEDVFKALENSPYGQEWWQSGAEEAFKAYAVRLVKLGMNPEEAYEFLCRIFGTVSGEYGN